MWTLLSSLDWRSIDWPVAWAGANASTIDIYHGIRRSVAENRLNIERLPQTITLALSEQILDYICCEEHDVRIGHILAA